MPVSKVLVTTSGTGSRLGELTRDTNKALVRVGKKPVISYIIESYPEDTTFVVTLGYYGDQVKEFLEITYPNRKFEFVNVDKYVGEGSSLGYSMLQAKDLLQCPFIYHASDTIVEGDIPLPDKNWIGVYKGGDASQYATWKIDTDKDLAILQGKGAAEFDFIHIGLIGIFDYGLFWNFLDKLYTDNPADQSLNDCRSLELMVEAGVKFDFVPFSLWCDTGNIPALENARSKFA